ncbi:hypothetical protein P5F61_10775 [Clostridium perfringens]|uniref:hypothetical protein n=1 Tax=Clostridium perfringens TaxID=1502 RepID=UPI0032DA7934|nr:hypothetical protein [Clostridium perfringens]MDM0957557.1 hypothetical protein [Clostridium perfringens]
MKKVKLVAEIAKVNVDGVRNLGDIYDKGIAQSTRKIVKDYIEFNAFSDGAKINVDRAKYEDIIDYDDELTSISVPIKSYYHGIFKQLCKNQNLKMKHLIRGLFEIYGDETITRKYNFEDQNILLEEWRKGNI